MRCLYNLPEKFNFINNFHSKKYQLSIITHRWCFYSLLFSVFPALAGWAIVFCTVGAIEKIINR